MSEDFGTIPAPASSIPGPREYEAAEKEAPAERVKSPLDFLKEEAKKDIEELITYSVRGRDGFKVQFSTAVDADDVKRWQKNAQGKRKNPADADPIVAAAGCLLEQNRAIFHNGKIVEDGTGSDMTLNSNEFVELYGGMGAIESLRKFLGDGQLLSMGGALLAEAGYGDEFEPVDPLKP